MTIGTVGAELFSDEGNSHVSKVYEHPKKPLRIVEERGITCPLYRGADKSSARPGRKEALKHARDASDFNNIETRAVIKFFFSCKARRRRKFTPF